MVRVILAIVSLYLTVAVAVAAYNTTHAPVDDDEDYKGGEGGWSAAGKGCSPTATLIVTTFHYTDIFTVQSAYLALARIPQSLYII